MELSFSPDAKKGKPKVGNVPKFQAPAQQAPDSNWEHVGRWEQNCKSSSFGVQITLGIGSGGFNKNQSKCETKTWAKL